MSDSTINLTSTPYSYLKNNSLREPEILKKLRDETHKKFQESMQISSEQGQFMCLLIEILGAKKPLPLITHMFQNGTYAIFFQLSIFIYIFRCLVIAGRWTPNSSAIRF